MTDSFEVIEVRILLGRAHTNLFVLLGQNARGSVGGWYSKRIAPDVAALAYLDAALAAEELVDWERGRPPNVTGCAGVRMVG